jgi:hypothetical protein
MACDLMKVKWNAARFMHTPEHNRDGTVHVAVVVSA